MDDPAPQPSEVSPSQATPPPASPSPPPIEALYEGERRDVHPGVYSAAKEWTRRRKEDAEASADVVEDPIDVLEYKDGRAADAEVDAKTAAEDINKYRQQKAAALLQEMIGEGQSEQQQPTVEQQQATTTPDDILTQVLNQATPEQREVLSSRLPRPASSTTKRYGSLLSN